MSRIPDALKKASVQQALGPDVLSGRERRPEALPEDLVNLADSLQEATTVRCRRLHWDLQDSIVSRGHSEDRIIAAEELRKLYAWLLQKQRATSQKTLLVTSAMPREGKTFLAVNLAWLMAQQKDQKVLLIDGDLRCPSAHLMLGASSAPGFAEYLGAQAEESQIIQQGPLSNLFFIPAGRCPGNPVALLSTAKLEKLCTRLSTCFDWIIFDSPPALSVTDARLMAAFTDGILLVVRAGASSREAVAKVRDLFADKGLLGVVLNSVEPSESYSSSYYRAYAKKSSKK
jgi:capsular exopolysaccharide synthesis family protein